MFCALKHCLRLCLEVWLNWVNGEWDKCGWGNGNRNEKEKSGRDECDDGGGAVL